LFGIAIMIGFIAGFTYVYASWHKKMQDVLKDLKDGR
jgi:hypothetical protein